MSEFLIDFIVCGFQKSGTSTLADFLDRQPSVNFCTTKEPMFFLEENNTRQKSADFSTFFDKSGRDRLKGEASTAYAFPRNCTYTAKAIHEHNTNVKLIFLVRNPINRVISAVRHSQNSSPGEHSEEWIQNRISNAITNSMYGEVISEYLRHFSSEKILIIKFEDLISEKVLPSICEFLNIPYSSESGLRKVNYTAQKVPNGAWFKIYRKYHGFFLKLPFSNWLRKAIRGILSSKSSKPDRKMELFNLKDSQVLQIREQLQQDDKRFEELFGFSYFNLTK